MGRPKPPCHLLILPGVTPAYKGLTPFGKIHLLFLHYVKFICIFKLFPELTTSVRAAYAGRTQQVLCNWGRMLKQSSAVHIQASYSADVILPGSSSKLQLLVIDLASVPGRQLVNYPTAQSLER